MSKETVHRTASHPAPQGAPASHSPDRATWRVAGCTLLAIAALSGVGNFVAVQPLAEHITATELTSARGSLLLGIAALSIVSVLDFFVSFVLYKSFRSTGARLMGIASGLRVAYATGFVFAISQLVPIARHLDGDLAGESTAARRAGVEAGLGGFNDVWHVALLLFGLHLIGLAVATRAARMPRTLVVLLAIAGGGYVFDSLSNMLTGTSPEVSAYTFIGEFTLALWLVAGRRRRALRRQHGMHPEPALA
jgi:hypothetical protein